MEPNDFHEIAEKYKREAESHLGENADVNDITEYIIGINSEDAHALMHYMISAVHQHMFESMISDGTASLSPTELIIKVLEMAVPTCLMISKDLYGSGDPKPKQGNHYFATVEAEITLKNLIEEKADLASIWPLEYVKEATQEFPDARDAFLAGVICGRKNG